MFNNELSINYFILMLFTNTNLHYLKTMFKQITNFVTKKK